MTINFSKQIIKTYNDEDYDEEIKEPQFKSKKY